MSHRHEQGGWAAHLSRRLVRQATLWPTAGRAVWPKGQELGRRLTSQWLSIFSRRTTMVLIGGVDFVSLLLLQGRSQRARWPWALEEGV